MKTRSLAAWTAGLILTLSALPSLADEPLPSWNDGPVRQSILDFVADVTTAGSPHFVPEPERIAVFDNDGTLWAEQPMYVQLAFALDRIRVLAPQHPEWATEEPFASLLKGDLAAALGGGEQAAMQILMQSHAGMTTAEFSQTVADWIATARNPAKDLRYQDMTYAPMVELLAYLRANGFKTFIVSGGGIDFMRVFSEQAYGIPPEQVIGSSGKLEFREGEGDPVLMKLPEINFIDDKEGKPEGIQYHIGRRPIAAFGNSDGDLAMLQWTCNNHEPSFCLYVHHTDADREWAYDRGSHIGELDKGLDEAAARGWTVVDMKTDWNRVFSGSP